MSKKNEEKKLFNFAVIVVDMGASHARALSSCVDYSLEKNEQRNF